MASPSDTKPQSPAERAESHDSDAPPKPRYDEKIEGDSFEVLRRYQEVTLPPNARLKLLSAPLPVVPPEELQDTVPPNARVVAAPVQGAARASRSAASTSETPVVDASRSQDTMRLFRVRRKQRLRAVVIGAVVVAALLATAGFLLSRPSQDAETTQSEQQRAASPAHTTSTPAVAPAVTAKPARPESAVPRAPAPPTEPSTQVAAQPNPAKSAPSSVASPKAPSNSAGEKSQPVPATTPKPASTPGTTHDSGSAFDGLMRPPSD